MDGKQRLRDILNADQRQELNRWFLQRLLGIGRQLPNLRRMWVVSACDHTLRLATDCGAYPIKEPDFEGAAQFPESRLNSALSFALLEARRKLAGDILVVSVDLPLAQADDLDRLCELGAASDGKQHCAIATDKTGHGTNAIFIPREGMLDFSYGADSCQRHAASARRHGMKAHVARIVNLACDIDTPQDYAGWRGAPAIPSNAITHIGTPKNARTLPLRLASRHPCRLHPG